MYTKQALKHALGEEIRIIRHLATKIDPAKVDWQPTSNQRTTLELLRYLTMCGIGPAAACAEGTWDNIGDHAEKHANMSLDGFDQAMAQQEADMNSLLDGLSDKDLETREAPMPWGAKHPLGQALYVTSVRFLVAYRMQLFLYAKESGASELTFHDAWMGMDKPATAGV